MQFGLIPPVPDLHRVPITGFHLVLSHLLGNQAYRDYYKNRGVADDYIVLDNGAHELGAGEGAQELLSKVCSIGAHEVVLPDVLFDRRGTVERTKRMLKYITSAAGYEQYLKSGAPRLMFVPQGTDRGEWTACLRDLFKAWDYFEGRCPGPLNFPVVGISKDYDTWKGGLVYLIGKYVEPLWETRDFDVHCLGWPSNLWVLAEVARKFAWVRSTDSAKPFVYAKAGLLLEPGGAFPKYPRRRPEYFEERHTKEEWEIALRNVEVFRAAATDTLISSPPTEEIAA